MNEIYYLIIFIVLIIIAIAFIRSNNKGLELEFNKLVAALGGSANIKKYEIIQSRFVVDLVDVSKVNKDLIIRLGAKGILEIENQIKIILGPESKRLKKYIEELK